MWTGGPGVLDWTNQSTMWSTSGMILGTGCHGEMINSNFTWYQSKTTFKDILYFCYCQQSLWNYPLCLWLWSTFTTTEVKNIICNKIIYLNQSLLFLAPLSNTTSVQCMKDLQKKKPTVPMFLIMKENFTQYTVWLTLYCNTTLWHRGVYYITLWLDRQLIIAFFFLAFLTIYFSL